MIEKIGAFLNLDYAEKREMGRAGRMKVEREFDRAYVVNAYMEETGKIIGGQ